MIMKRTGFSIYETDGHLKVYISRRSNDDSSHRIYYPSLASVKKINAYCQANRNKIQIEFYKNNELSLWIE